MVTIEDVKKLKVQELKEECKKLGLPVDGKKQDLVDRLEAALAKSAQPIEPAAEASTAPEEAVAATGSVDGAAADATNGAETGPKVVSIAGEKPMTELEKKKLRAQKFGVALNIPEGTKKQLRAERFGLAQAAASKAADSTSAAAGATKPTAAGAKPAVASKPIPLAQAPSLEEIEKRKARAARFGTAAPTTAEEEAARKLARAKRFGTMDEKTKQELRAKRFADPPAAGDKTALVPLEKKVRAEAKAA